MPTGPVSPTSAPNSPAPTPEAAIPQSESIRADAQMTRTDALSALYGQEKVVFEQYLAGDEAARKAVKQASLSSALFNSYIHAKADVVEIGELIRLLNDPETFDGSGNASMSMPIGNSGASVGMTGGPFTQVAPGVTMVGGPSVPAGPAVSPAIAALLLRVENPDPVVQDQNIRNEISQRIDEWEAIYGVMRGGLLHEIARKVIQTASGNGLTVLLDRGMLKPNDQRQVRHREQGKRYAQDEYDTQTVFFADSILKAGNVSLLKSLLAHPTAAGFVAQGKDESVYSAQDLLFDRREADLLDSFMVSGGRPNLCSKEYAKRAWVMEIVNKMDADDMPVFERLVKVHGMKLDVFDEMRVTPFARGVILGNRPLVEFLKDQADIDFFMIDTMNHTALDYAYSAPLRRAEKQSTHMESFIFDTKCFTEEFEEWQELVAEQTAAGVEEKDLPQPPEQPVLGPCPPDYPLEIIGIVEQIFATYQPVAKIAVVADENMDELDALGNLNTY